MNQIRTPTLPALKPQARVAYFSMEIAVSSEIPSYSGGLGVLAGDTLAAAADLNLPIVAITLLHRKGYFTQHLDESGQQTEEPVNWNPSEVLEAIPVKVQIPMRNRLVTIGVWRKRIHGIRSHQVPVYFLDTNLPENHPDDQNLTDWLYGGDHEYRLCQEVILGMGGVRILQALGYNSLTTYHMNEGHSALLTIALLLDHLHGREIHQSRPADQESIRRMCVFTTHTPVPAGHDQFSLELVRKVLGNSWTDGMLQIGVCLDDRLNMTYLALMFSRYINGVAIRHGQVSRGMFPHYPIDSITNGIHSNRWVSSPMEELFDRHIPHWRQQALNLRYAVNIDPSEVQKAHDQSKAKLIHEIQQRTEVQLRPDVFTIGFARRATEYKRMNLIFSDIERLRSIARRFNGLQVIFGGKAHPRDMIGKQKIMRVFNSAEKLKGDVTVLYLENYEMEIAKTLCSGVDLWLNTPKKPEEASGTSGMKAAINGVPSLSTVDGWWVEGNIEGVTGWSIGSRYDVESDSKVESESLYQKLEEIILPLYHQHPEQYAVVRRSAIAINGSFFNAHRMILQYAENAYELWVGGPPPETQSILTNPG